MIRKLLDKIEPHFLPGGKLEKLYPLYEAKRYVFVHARRCAKGKTHVRDAIDTKRMMSMVIVALIPCIFMAFYNTGYQGSESHRCRERQFRSVRILQTRFGQGIGDSKYCIGWGF